jgi:hypothetical protein
LHETAKAPWDEDAVREAHENNHPSVYNTSSTTTVLSHPVGDTKMEAMFFSFQEKERRLRKRKVGSSEGFSRT